MNIRPSMTRSLQVPPDVERRRWTVADVRRLEEAGIFHPEERVELIAGEIVKVAPKGARHEVLRNELVVHLADRRPRDVKFAEETPLTLGDEYEPEPDIVLFPAELRVNEVRGDTVLLVIEIADTSLKWDMETKSRAYAMFGVREYWVVNAQTLETTVHLEPSDEGYSRVMRRDAGEALFPTAVPSVTVRLADLPLEQRD